MPWQYSCPPELTSPTVRMAHFQHTSDLRTERLAQLGWQPLSDSHDRSLDSHLRKRFPLLHGSRPPEPYVVWDVSLIYEDRKSYDLLEVDLNVNALRAIRECTSADEEILAIDYQHPWYRFQPHTLPLTGDPYDWAVPILPDGLIPLFLPYDFRFGIVGIPHHTICIFGDALLQAFSRNRPVLFDKQITWPVDPWPEGEKGNAES